MRDLNQEWAEAVITALPHLNVAEPPAHTCSCTNGGEPYELDGIMVVSRSPACHIHVSDAPYIARKTCVTNMRKDAHRQRSAQVGE